MQLSSSGNTTNNRIKCFMCKAQLQPLLEWLIEENLGSGLNQKLFMYLSCILVRQSLMSARERHTPFTSRGNPIRLISHKLMNYSTKTVQCETTYLRFQKPL